MRKPVTILIIIIVNTVFPAGQLVRSLDLTTDHVSTAENSLVLQEGTIISLLEIGFKNSPDYLQFRVSGPQKNINLKGLAFYDDRDFKTIEKDYFVNSGDIVTLNFDSSLPDDPDQHVLYALQKGLTGTTEQILIRSGGQNLDFLCWYKEPPTAAEIKDFEKIRPPDLWEDEDIGSCLDSTTVKNGQILEKAGGEQNSSSWQIRSEQPIAKTTDDPKTTDEKSPAADSQKNLATLIENSGELTDDIPVQITEIFPLPASKQEYEWVEIQNTGDFTLNLTGWIIDDEAGGSKPHRLPQTILEPATPVLLNLKELKITLNNDADSVRLFRADGGLVAEQSYSGGKKGQSYALISLDEEDNWAWSDQPTPGQPNPRLTGVNGTIISPPQFDELYHFALRDDQDVLYLVQFTEDRIKAPLAKEIFLPDSRGLFTGEVLPAPQNPGGYQKILKLYNYEITGQPENFLYSPVLIIFAIIIALIIAAIYLFYRQIRKWKHFPSAISPSPSWPA